MSRGAGTGGRSACRAGSLLFSGYPEKGKQAVEQVLNRKREYLRCATRLRPCLRPAGRAADVSRPGGYASAGTVAALCIALVSGLVACQKKIAQETRPGENAAPETSSSETPNGLAPYLLTEEQSATYITLFTASVLSRQPGLTPQESNEFSAIGVKVDGITTERGRVQFIRKMIEIFGEQRAREIGAVFFNDDGKATHAWPKPLENQPGSAIPFPSR